MAFIKIIQFPNGQSAGRGYTFKKRKDQHEKIKIVPGEIAEIPDEDLDWHLSKGIVQQCRGPSTFEQEAIESVEKVHRRARGKRGDNNRAPPVMDIHSAPEAVKAYTGLGTDDR